MTFATAFTRHGCRVQPGCQRLCSCSQQPRSPTVTASHKSSYVSRAASLDAVLERGHSSHPDRQGPAPATPASARLLMRRGVASLGVECHSGRNRLKPGLDHRLDYARRHGRLSSSVPPPSVGRLIKNISTLDCHILRCFCFSRRPHCVRSA